MKTPCIGCGVLVQTGTGGRCQGCKSPGRKARSTAAWTQKSRAVRAAGVCARCGATGRPLEAHHVIPVSERPDLALSGPVVALCKPCHLAVK